MSLTTLRWTALVSILFVGLSGCGYFQGASTDDDADLTDLDDIEKAKPLEVTSREVAEAAPVEEGVLELKLKVNDRFPLSKTVEQRLMTTDSSGVTVSTSQSTMMLSLVVDEVLPDGRKRMTVHYHRVQYQQNIRDKKIEYSSDRPGEAIPPEALLYAGLANNGFSFWIGPNNKVMEVVGFNDFLRRCLRNVPSQHLADVKQQLESTKSEDGIANFIDDSIGLLPYSDDPNRPGVAVKEGTKWSLEPRHTEAPIPMFVTTECVLKELSQNSAVILIAGQISGPPTPVMMHSRSGNMKVLVKGGHCTGTCKVDRKTGLPTQSQLHRDLELAMELPDGQSVRQNKVTVSTIKSYLSQSESDSRVQQTNFRNAIGTEDHRRVQHAGGSPQD